MRRLVSRLLNVKEETLIATENTYYHDTVMLVMPTTTGPGRSTADARTVPQQALCQNLCVTVLKYIWSMLSRRCLRLMETIMRRAS